MERIRAFYHRKLDNYTRDEYLIILFVCTLFLPAYIPIIFMIGILIYLIKQHRLLNIIKEVPSTKIMIGFSIMEILISCLFKNYIGAICGVALFIVFLFIAFYQTVVTKRLFEILMDASCILSLFCVGYAIMEYFSIIELLGFEFLDLIVVDDPWYRVNSTFFNANYYAMMIEFVILICIYKMMQMKTKRRIIFYMVTIFFNAFALYLTGCRTAWPTFALSVPLMFLMNHKYGYFGISSTGVIGCSIAILLNPDLMPRDGAGASFVTRTDIWRAAIKEFFDHPFFGQGPMTYFHVYDQYGGPLAHHSHSVYLDPLVSFGIVGTCMMLSYIGIRLREVYILFKRKIDVRLCSLILAFFVTILIHGILDYTIFWIQTGILFLIVLGSTSMYFRKS